MSDDLPLVCICIPTYNAETTIQDTLTSILGQTYANIVVHISDNASTDDTLFMVESIADSRVQIHRQTKNIGPEANFNRCIQLAEGKYTAIFHADDIYNSDMVAKQVEFLESSPDAGAVFTEANLIDDKGNRFGVLRLPRSLKSKTGLYNFEVMFKALLRHANFFICPSFMVRTQVYQRDVRVWRGDEFGSSADLDVWLRILQLHRIGHIPERLMEYRISQTQGSSQVRQATSPAALFQTLDFYLRDDNIKRLLDHDDLINYQRLERRDRVMRAVNLFLGNSYNDAKLLLNDVFSKDALMASFQTQRGLFTFLMGSYVRLLLSIGFHGIGKKTLVYMRQVLRR